MSEKPIDGALAQPIRELETIASKQELDEEVSKRNERLLRLYMEFTPAATAMCDLEMRYLAYSRRWIYDYNLPEENLLGRCHYDVFKSIPEHWKKEHQRCFKGEIIVNEEEPFTRADGSVDWVRRNLHPWRMENDEIGGLIMFTEVITEQKKAEAEKERLQDKLQQAQKLESIGTLAGGIAHNFNNILMGIQGRVSLMMLNKIPSDADYGHLNGIEESVRNASELTKDLLGFAQGGQYEVKSTNLNELIKKENKVFGRTKREINFHERYEEPLWTVAVDRGQIQQALLNLYVNAWQAMPDGGDIYIQTENVVLDDTYVQPFDIPPGKYVKISVKDNGVGIDYAIQDKIFDPFFSTKEQGKGSGLALASVYGIIKNHGGLVLVRSEIGKGAAFDIFLPATDKGQSEKIQKPVRGDIHYGQGTILLVDDEEIVIDIGIQMLRALGYRVLIARSGADAVELYEKHQSKIDLVILDMIMPGMSGSQTFDRLIKANKDVKVLLSSGYSINGTAKEILDRGCSGFLQKPFSLNALSESIRNLIDWV